LSDKTNNRAFCSFFPYLIFNKYIFKFNVILILYWCDSFVCGMSNLIGTASQWSCRCRSISSVSRYLVVIHCSVIIMHHFTDTVITLWLLWSVIFNCIFVCPLFYWFLCCYFSIVSQIVVLLFYYYCFFLQSWCCSPEVIYHAHLVSYEWPLTSPHFPIFSARCNIYISHLCYNVSVRLSVRLSVTYVH